MQKHVDLREKSKQLTTQVESQTMQDLNKKLSLIQEKENTLIELERKLQRWYIVLQEKEQELVE